MPLGFGAGIKGSVFGARCSVCSPVSPHSCPCQSWGEPRLSFSLLRTHQCPSVSIPSELSLPFCPSRCTDLTLTPSSFLFLPMQGKPSALTAGTPPDTAAGTAGLQRARWSSDNKCHVSSGQREGIPEWEARTIQLLAQAVSRCGPHGDNNLAGKLLWKKDTWGGGWGGERKKQCKQKEEMLWRARWDCRERSSSGARDPAKYWHHCCSLKRDKNTGSLSPWPRKLWEQTLLLPSPRASSASTGKVCHPKTAGQEWEKKIKSFECFLVPQQLKTPSNILRAPNFSWNLCTSWKTQASPEWPVWAFDCILSFPYSHSKKAWKCLLQPYIQGQQLNTFFFNFSKARLAVGNAHIINKRSPVMNSGGKDCSMPCVHTGFRNRDF